MSWLNDLWTTIQNTVMMNWHNILRFVLFLIIGIIVIRVALFVLQKALNGPNSKLKGAAGHFLMSLIRVGLIILYIIILLSMLGVDTTSLVAIFSVLTLAISLAVQDVIANLASGIMLVATKPFDEGDFVDISGISGTVTEIKITSTKLTTADNKVVTMPNSTVTTANIINYSVNDTRRLDFIFSVAYGSDVEQVKKLILSVVEKHDNVLTDPAPFIRLTEHGSSSLDFVVRLWVKQADYWAVNFDIKEEVLAAFEAAGIDVPFPQMDVHVKQ